MHGLQDIKRMNEQATTPTLNVDELPLHVRDEYGDLISSIEAGYESGHYSYAQYIEELLDARATYL